MPLLTRPVAPAQATRSVTTSTERLKPEQMSLSAHQHIQQYLRTQRKEVMDDDDLTAALRLSQHLRVFGLLSAAGFVNQSNAQGGKVRQRTVPVWESLLGQLLDETDPPQQQQLMAKMVELAQQEPAQYMALWRRSLALSHHWNFWARAYKEKPCTQGHC